MLATIGAGVFSDLSVHNFTTVITADSAYDTAAEFDPLFATETETAAVGTFTRIKNVRSFPSIGVPSKIVNVPSFGSKITKQIQGQADAPTLEVTINFVPSDWAPSTLIGAMIGDGKLHAFRFTLLNAEPTLATTAKYASSAAGVGSVPNAMWYWVGTIEALLVNPQLTDANTAVVTLAAQTKFFGPFSF